MEITERHAGAGMKRAIAILVGLLLATPVVANSKKMVDPGTFFVGIVPEMSTEVVEARFAARGRAQGEIVTNESPTGLTLDKTVGTAGAVRAIYTFVQVGADVKIYETDYFITLP